MCRVVKRRKSKFICMRLDEHQADAFNRPIATQTTAPPRTCLSLSSSLTTCLSFFLFLCFLEHTRLIYQWPHFETYKDKLFSVDDLHLPQTFNIFCCCQSSVHKKNYLPVLWLLELVTSELPDWQNKLSLPLQCFVWRFRLAEFNEWKRHNMDGNMNKNNNKQLQNIPNIKYYIFLILPSINIFKPFYKINIWIIISKSSNISSSFFSQITSTTSKHKNLILSFFCSCLFSLLISFVTQQHQ